MKLVELLAKELSEWPEEAAHASQDYDREIRFYDADEEQLSRLDFFVETRADDACDAITFAGGGVRVSKAQWQAERDRQNGGEWKRHRGGKCPVDAGTKVITRYRDGVICDWCMTRNAETCIEHLDAIWSHSGGSTDIMAYKIEPQAEEVPMIATGDTREYKGPFPCSPAGEPVTELEWDIQFQQGVFHMEAKTDQIDGPIKWRDTVTELDAYIEEFTREREALIERLALEGFALIPAMTAVMGVADVDMSDWRNWKVGDEIEMIADDWADLSRDCKYKITHAAPDGFSLIDDEGDTQYLTIDRETVFVDGRVPDFKWISRP